MTISPMFSSFLSFAMQLVGLIKLYFHQFALAILVFAGFSGTVHILKREYATAIRYGLLVFFILTLMFGTLGFKISKQYGEVPYSNLFSGEQEKPGEKPLSSAKGTVFVRPSSQGNGNILDYLGSLSPIGNGGNGKLISPF